MTPYLGFAETSPPQTIVVPDPKNRDGKLGPTCKWCDGWGWLGHVHRTQTRWAQLMHGDPPMHGPCHKCAGTGIEPDPHLRAYMDRVARETQALRQRAEFLEPGLKEALELHRLLDIQNSRQYWSEMIAWATASGATVASSTAETIIFPNVTIPANYLQDGRALRLRVQGQHTTPGSSTVTLIFQLRWGGVSGTMICKTGTITTLISLTAAFFDLDILLQTRSNGSTGTVMGNGLARVYGATAPTIGSATGAPANAAMTNGGQITPAVATLDLTADTALSITGQMGQVAAGCTFIGLSYTIEALN